MVSPRVFGNVRGIVCARLCTVSSQVREACGGRPGPTGPPHWDGRGVKREGDLATWLVLMQHPHGHFTCLPQPQFPLCERQV